MAAINFVHTNLYTEYSRVQTALGPTQPPVQCVPGLSRM